MLKSFWEHLSSGVGYFSLVLVLLGGACAWRSLYVSHWGTSYLQNLSTTLLGMGLGTLVVDFLLTRHRERLSAETRRPNEISVRQFLSEVIAHLKDTFPKDQVPEKVHLEQYRWAGEQVREMYRLCDNLALRIEDRDYARRLSSLHIRYGEWSSALERLIDCIKDKYPKADRLEALEAICNKTDDLLEVARILVEYLGRNQYPSVLHLP